MTITDRLNEMAKSSSKECEWKSLADRDFANNDLRHLHMNSFTQGFNSRNAEVAALHKALKIADEALKFAIEDVSTGHWEDDCKVPPTYEPCDHCYLKEAQASILRALSGEEKKG